jgi:hypothetical protein
MILRLRLLTYQLYDVLMVHAPMNSDLPSHLEMVQLRELGLMVGLESHHEVCVLNLGKVDCGSVAAANLVNWVKTRKCTAKKHNRSLHLR